MSAFYDLIGAFVAMLMSAAFLHFGAAGESPDAPPAASHALASSAAPNSAMDDETPDNASMSAVAPRVRPVAHHLAAHGRCPGMGGGASTVDTVRALSPVRRG